MTRVLRVFSLLLAAAFCSAQSSHDVPKELPVFDVNAIDKVDRSVRGFLSIRLRNLDEEQSHSRG